MYPIIISKEENERLKNPFLETPEYEQIHKLPEGPLLLIRKSNVRRTVEKKTDDSQINK